MKRTYLFFLLLFLVHVLWAESQITGSRELSLQASSRVEAMLGFTQSLRFPFMQGTSPLTEGNNITLNLGAEVTPISLRALTELVWTPIAFFELSAGGHIGSGWNINLFGQDIYGIGLNQPDDNGSADGKSEHSGSAFDGMHWKMQGGAAVQADLAAFFPGAWNHLVMRSYHEINHRGYTRASSGLSWYFENDDGENRNGLNYYSNTVIGYQMPIILSMVALMAEAELFLYNTPDRSLWGDDRIYWIFSALFNFSLTPQFDIGLGLQFHTQRNYLQSNWEELFYQNRLIDNSRPVRLEFYRFATVMTYRF